MVKYLKRTRQADVMLVCGCQANVVQCFQQLHRLLDEHYTDEDRLIIAAPTTEQVDNLATKDSDR